jgi:hypothetical protein
MLLKQSSITREKLANWSYNANGTVSSNRTYQDLLKNTRDELNFENIVTAEQVNLNGTQSLFKEANIG